MKLHRRKENFIFDPNFLPIFVLERILRAQLTFVHDFHFTFGININYQTLNLA